MRGVSANVHDDGTRGRAAVLEERIDPRAVFSDGERIGVQEKLEAPIDEEHLDVRLRDERANERPRARQIEVRRVGGGVPSVALRQVVTDVDVASRLVAHVRREVAAEVRADVADVQLGAIGEARAHAGDGGEEIVARLFGAPFQAGGDALPIGAVGQGHAVDQRPRVRAGRSTSRRGRRGRCGPWRRSARRTTRGSARAGAWLRRGRRAGLRSRRRGRRRRFRGCQLRSRSARRWGWQHFRDFLRAPAMRPRAPSRSGSTQRRQRVPRPLFLPAKQANFGRPPPHARRLAAAARVPTTTNRGYIRARA